MRALQAFYNLYKGVATAASPGEFRVQYKFENNELVRYQPHERTGEQIQTKIVLDRGELLEEGYKNRYTRGYSSFSEVEDCYEHPFFIMLEQVISHPYDSKMVNEKGETIYFECFYDSFKYLSRRDADGNDVNFTLSQEDIEGTWTYIKEAEEN